MVARKSGDGDAIRTTISRTGALSELRVKTRKFRSDLDKISRAAYRANVASANWLSREAQKELKRKIRTSGRQQRTNQKLVNFTGDTEANSTIARDGSGFRWYDPQKTAELEINLYYRIIEQGRTRIQNPPGQRVPVGYFQGNTLYPAMRSRSNDLGLSRGGGFFTANEQTPKLAKGYFYLSTTIDRFRKEKVYERYIRAELSRFGPRKKKGAGTGTGLP